MQLRPYQQDLIDKARKEISAHKSVAIMLPTGGGKSHIFASITQMAYEKKNRIWICVPRNELIWQTSEHLFNRKIPHGIIKAGSNESRAYNVHVISMETIKRRLRDGKIKNFPDLIIFDEGHIQLDGQIKIVRQLPEETKVLMFSATMERLDGRGLGIVYDEDGSYKDGLYEVLVQGAGIVDLIEMEYLSKMKYFCPPLEGLEDIHRKGTEYDQNELDALLKRRAVYGQAIDHYRKYADGKRCLVYCRSIKASKETAQRFREAGYRFENIDGTMTDKQRRDLIEGLRSGKIQGLTSCEILTYGLDVPAVEVCIMLRPTLSRALYMQMIGRSIRTAPGKEYAIILDHVNNLLTHDHPLAPYEWNFYGKEKRKKKGKSKDILKLCKNCWMWYNGSTCPNCGTGKEARKSNGLVEIDGRLVEHKGPIALNDRPPEEKKDFYDKIASAKEAFQSAAELGEVDLTPVRELCDIASELGRAVMWVYYTLNTTEHAVNVPLLTAIQTVKGYKHYWTKFKRQELQKRTAPKEERFLL